MRTSEAVQKSIHTEELMCMFRIHIRADTCQKISSDFAFPGPRDEYDMAYDRMYMIVSLVVDEIEEFLTVNVRTFV